jgi:hypothetical protein
VGFLRRHGYSLMLTLLSGVIVVLCGFIVIVVLPDILGTSGQSGQSPSPTPSGTASAQFMSWVAMPADADCSACHVTSNGSVGLVNVPPIAHPLEGWTNCTACHSNGSLVATAPGHAGIHASDCLLCHQPAQLPPPLSRPHRDRQNQDCLDCHGSTAPLPADMAHRAGTVCWLCHRLPDVQPPVPAHAVAPGETDCLTCHVAGRVGALPEDHATRTASECLLCHGPAPSASPEPTVSPGPSVLSRLTLPSL